MLSGGTALFAPYQNRPPKPNDLILCFQQNQILLSKTENADPPTVAVLAEVLPGANQLLPLFSLPHCNAYAFDTKTPLPIPSESNLEYIAIDIFRQLANPQNALMLISAWHLMVWHRRHRFCGACGTPLVCSDTERALCCPNCTQIFYPTISPAVSVAISDGDRLILARNVRSTFPHFSLVAGYVEVGETLEETVKREVMEEVGLKVKNIRYIASQAWGLSQSQMVGFHAELDGSDQITLQESELSEARWFHRGELPVRPNSLSLSFEMIERFRLGTL